MNDLSDPHIDERLIRYAINNLSDLHIDERLIRCVRFDDLAGVASLLAQGADPHASDFTALRLAAHHGHVECLRLLIPVSGLAAAAFQCVRVAARGGHAECVRLLVFASGPTDTYTKALHQAAINGCDECVKLLIPVSSPLVEILGALISTASNGHASTLSIMFAHEPRLLELLDLPSLLATAKANRHGELAVLLSSIIERQSLSAHVPEPAPSLSPPPPRL